VKKLLPVAAIIFVICIPTFLITTDLRLAINNSNLYEYGLDKYNASEKTGLSEDELTDTVRSMISYFNSGEDLFDTDVFNEREIAHLKDVKSLVSLDYCLQIASLTFIIMYVVLQFALRRGAIWRDIGRLLIGGGVLTIGLLAFLGFWAATHFDSLFLVFHKISFTNDLWQLSAGDNMIRMFPEAFFNDAALFVAAAIIIEALIIAGGAFLLLKLKQKSQAAT